MGGACMTDTRPRHEDETFYVNKQITSRDPEFSRKIQNHVKLEEIEVAKRRNPVSGVPLSDQKNSVTVIIY